MEFLDWLVISAFCTALIGIVVWVINQKNNNSAAVSRLDAEITRKTDTLTEYTNAKDVELESLKKNLQNSDSFYKKLYGVLERVAENEGYSMILSLQQANAVLWYSPSVDITEKVIAELGI